MSLIAIKNHLMKVKVATLSSLCSLFDAEPDTIRCLLSHLMQKGCVRQCVDKPACAKKCFGCQSVVTEMYEWIEPASHSSVSPLKACENMVLANS